MFSYCQPATSDPFPPGSLPTTLPQPAVLHWVVVTQSQDPALHLIESQTIGLNLLIDLAVQIPLQNPPTLQQINTVTQFGVICELAEGVLDPLMQAVNEDTKQG